MHTQWKGKSSTETEQLITYELFYLYLQHLYFKMQNSLKVFLIRKSLGSNRAINLHTLKTHTQIQNPSAHFLKKTSKLVKKKNNNK